MPTGNRAAKNFFYRFHSRLEVFIKLLAGFGFQRRRALAVKNAERRFANDVLFIPEVCLLYTSDAADE